MSIGHFLLKLSGIILKVKFVILDEVSMLEPGVFTMFEEATRCKNEDTRSFGGLHVVLLFDQLQLPPVGRYFLYRDVIGDAKARRGHQLYRQFKRVIYLEELIGRIPAVDPAHQEFRRVENPDLAGGALHALDRRPIMTAARALNLTTPGAATPSAHFPNAVVPHIRPIIGIDLGQRFQAVAVYDNLSPAALRTHSIAQAQPNQIAIIKQLSRHSRRQQIRRVRGRQYREIDKSAWFERKHACRVAQSEELQDLIQLFRGRKDALWGAGVARATNYLNIVYLQLDQIRAHFYSPFYYRSSVTRATYQQRALDLTARSLIHPTFRNVHGESIKTSLDSIDFRQTPVTKQLLSRPTHYTYSKTVSL